MTRTAKILLAAIVIVLLGTSTAAGTTGDDSTRAPSARNESELLAQFWRQVLSTPTPENPFTVGSACVQLSGHVVVPFATFGSSVDCTVSGRTRLLVTPVTYECSTVETPTVDASPRELRACARGWLDAYTEHTVTLDGRAVPVRPVLTGVLSVRLPADNVFGTTQPRLQSAASAWAVLLPPLSPGRHVVLTHADGPDVDAADSTTIVTVSACR